MNETIKLAKNNETIVNFDLDIEGGIDSEEPQVKFTVSLNEQTSVSFFATHKQDKLWEVKVPEVSLPDNATYMIEVIVGHYYFKPAQGNISFDENLPQVTTQNVSNVSPTKTEGKILKSKNKILTEKQENQTTNKKSKKDIKDLIKEIEKIQTTPTFNIEPINTELSKSIVNNFDNLSSLKQTKEQKIKKTLEKIIKSI
jgi:hypothetical protein